MTVYIRPLHSFTGVSDGRRRSWQFIVSDSFFSLCLWLKDLVATTRFVIRGLFQFIRISLVGTRKGGVGVGETLRKNFVDGRHWKSS